MAKKHLTIDQLKEVNELFVKIEELHKEKQSLTVLINKMAAGDELHLNMHAGSNCPDENSVSKEDDFETLADRMGWPLGILTNPRYTSAASKEISKRNKSREENFVSIELKDIVGMEVLAVLIRDKESQIRALVDRLVEMGFKR